MTVRRRRGLPPLPPPLGAIVVDGANVIASSRARPLERLDLITAWFQEWRPDLPIQVFVDHATAVRCRPEVQAVLRARSNDVTPARPRYAVVPRDRLADEVLLQHARAHAGLVVSNDRYFDFDDLRRNAITVQFTLAGMELHVFDEATWFRSPGTALRVPMATLRALGAPAG